MECSLTPLIERITLRRLSPRFGFADVRLPDVNLHDMRVELRNDGTLSIRAPARTDQHGREWPAYHLQPGTREAIECAIAAVWARAAG